MLINQLPDAVRNKAIFYGAQAWLEGLPQLIETLSAEWGMRIGRTYTGGTESCVVEATLADGTEAVLKLVIPRAGDDIRGEVAVLRLAGGEGCPLLLREDIHRNAMLLERLGPALSERNLPLTERHEILCAAAMRLWRPVDGKQFPTGAQKARSLVDFILKLWGELDRPCSERAIDYAVQCAHRRAAAHDDERAVLVHGDLHSQNALRAGQIYKLTDPDGLLAEAEYDLGILMREDPLDMINGDPMDRAHWLARRTNRNATAIWEGALLNVSRPACFARALTCSRSADKC